MLKRKIKGEAVLFCRGKLILVCNQSVTAGAAVRAIKTVIKLN